MLEQQRTSFIPRTVLIFVATLLGPVGATSLRAETPAPDAIDFSRQIRPILSENCFQCHGPDAKVRKAKLRLDSKEGAFSEAHSGQPIISAGKSAESELIARVTSRNSSELMPPPKSGKKLTPPQIELLRQWIDQGARWTEHWAFAPLQRPALPPVKDRAWVRNPIDRFILARLEAERLKPSPEAAKETLIRRLSLDLIGLLPSPEEVEAFVHDQRPDAYEQLIEHFLRSPHYGERWGRHWLDAARYADSNGYSIDSERTMWPYRDWVIRALNEDMPFTQFTIEQLAGDLLPNPTKLQRIATGFHRNTMINEEGGTDAEQFRNEIAVDRVNTTGAAWLGLTLGCAQCHSHKFDPISHREYYQLFAFFNQGTDVNNKGETVAVLPGEILGPGEAAGKEDSAAKALQAKVEELKKAASQRQTAWERQLAQAPAEPSWTPLAVESYEAISNRTLRQLDDGSILAMREGAPNDTYEIKATVPLTRVAALRLSVLPHDSLPSGGPGTAGNGNFILSEIELRLDGQRVAFVHALADHQKTGYPVAGAIDGLKNTGWALEMTKGGKGAHEAWFCLDKPLEVTGKQLTVRLRQDINDHYLIGRFALSATAEPPATHPDRKLWQSTLAAAKKSAGERSKTDAALLTRVFGEIDRAFAAATREAERLGNTANKATPVLVMRETDKPRETFIHLRGDFLNLDKKTGPLTPDTPACLPPLQPAGPRPTRLDLARWLVREDNPLTPRVTVNRVWMRYFGQGLVETENDFGMQGSPPTHPQLLDWLATEFIRQDWSLKQLHRLIVTSATYRQSSRQRPELAEVDPRNLLLARQNRIRLDAEVVRDAALSASGLLSPTLGGPTVRPPQPEGVYAFTQTQKTWKVSEGPDRYRRALYTTFFRSAPYPLFTTFDAPNFSTVCTRRVRSNTPLQALALANDEVFVELAQGLALRLWQEVPDPGADPARVVRAFRICYGREPSARETAAVVAFLQRQLDRFGADPKGAQAAAPARRPTQLPEPVSAAWAAVARALINTDEFITRE